MATPLVATAGAALALYVYLKAKPEDGERGMAPPSVQVDACRDVERPPNTWSEALYYFKEVFKYMYTETLGRWHTVDLFVGLAYLSHRKTQEYPAIDIMEYGRAISCNLSMNESLSLLTELKEIRRYLLYCRGLKYKKPGQQLKFWEEHLLIDGASCILVHQYSAGLLRPAYALIADEAVESIVLCIRGTQSLKDMFTSLVATTQPHHRVETDGVVLGYGHLGMLAAARWLLKQVKGPLKDAMARYPDYKLRIVGHSMGGGTAVLLTTMLRESMEECADAKCYALACPACMTLELANSCKDYVTSVINGTDIVPTFSAATVDALREDVTNSSWFVEFQRDLRASIYHAVQGGIQGFGSATSWTTRNIISPAVTIPFQACYSTGRLREPLLPGQTLDAVDCGVWSGDGDMSLFEGGMKRSISRAQANDEDCEESEHSRPAPVHGSLSQPSERGWSNGMETERPGFRESQVSESVMAEALESCLYVAAQVEGGGLSAGARMGLSDSETPVGAQHNGSNLVDPVRTAMHLLDQELQNSQGQRAATDASGLPLPQQTAPSQMKQKLWPWWTNNEDGMASLRSGSSLAEGSKGEGQDAQPGSGAQSSSVTGQSTSQISPQGPTYRRVGYPPTNKRSWLWQGMFKGCMAPRPQNAGVAWPAAQVTGAMQEYEDEDEIPPEDSEAYNAGVPADPAATRHQLQAGITAVVSAVTNETEEEVQLDDATMRELRAAESDMREVEGPSSPREATGRGSSGGNRPTRSWASFLRGSSSSRMDCTATERPVDGSGGKRHLYPAGRVLHFFPKSLIDPLGDGADSCDGPSTSASRENTPLGLQKSHRSAANLVPISPGVSPNMAETGSARHTLALGPFALYEVPANEAYGRVKLCRSMVMDHLTPAYLVALDSVMAQVKAELVKPLAKEADFS